MFTVSSYEHAQQVLTDNVRFSSAGYAATIGPVMGRTILEMDPPEHQRHRALAAGAFRARVLDQWSDAVIGATINELIGAFAGDGRADLIRQLTFPFPVQVIARVLGLAEADWPRFLRLSTQLIAVMRNWDGAVAASRELRGYFAEIIADRRRNTRDDLVSQLISAEVTAPAQRRGDLPVPAAAPAGRGGDDVPLVEQPAVRVAVRPDQLKAVRADRGLVPQAIEEALRWETPLLTVARSATEDVELGGVRIPAGALWRCRWGRRTGIRGGIRSRMPSTSSGGACSTSRSGTGRTSAWACIWPGGDGGAAQRGARSAAGVAARSGRRRPPHSRADISVAPEPARPIQIVLSPATIMRRG